MPQSVDIVRLAPSAVSRGGGGTQANREALLSREIEANERALRSKQEFAGEQAGKERNLDTLALLLQLKTTADQGDLTRLSITESSRLSGERLASIESQATAQREQDASQFKTLSDENERLSRLAQTNLIEERGRQDKRIADQLKDRNRDIAIQTSEVAYNDNVRLAFSAIGDVLGLAGAEALENGQAKLRIINADLAGTYHPIVNRITFLANKSRDAEKIHENISAIDDLVDNYISKLRGAITGREPGDIVGPVAALLALPQLTLSRVGEDGKASVYVLLGEMRLEASSRDEKRLDKMMDRIAETALEFGPGGTIVSEFMRSIGTDIESMVALKKLELQQELRDSTRTARSQRVQTLTEGGVPSPDAGFAPTAEGERFSPDFAHVETGIEGLLRSLEGAGGMREAAANRGLPPGLRLPTGPISAAGTAAIERTRLASDTKLQENEDQQTRQDEQEANRAGMFTQMQLRFGASNLKILEDREDGLLQIINPAGQPINILKSKLLENIGKFKRAGFILPGME